MINTLEKLEKIIIYTTIFLVPIVVLSIFPNPFITPKVVLIYIGASLAILVRALITLSRGNLQFSRSAFDLPVGLIAVFALLSAIIISPNKTEAFFIPGMATLLVGSALFYYLLTSRDAKEKVSLKITLFVSASISAFITLLAFGNVTSKLTFLPALLRLPTFTTTEGYLASAIFFTVVIPIGISLIISQKETIKKVAMSIGVAVLILGLLASVSGIFNIINSDTGRFTLLDPATSWQVFVETIKDSPILGSGPGNYLTSFTRFRPISFNNSEIWSVRFTTSGNYYMTYATETGLLGLAAIIVLLLSIYKVTKRSIAKSRSSKGANKFSENSNLIALIVLAVALLFFPATASIIFILFVLLGLVALDQDPKKIVVNLTASTLSSGSTPGRSRLPAALVTIPVIILTLFLFFQSAKIISAEVTYRKALVAINSNDAQEAFRLIDNTVTLNPGVDRYHSTVVQLYLAIARSLVQKENITDSDREQIALAIQNAIAQAKAVVALNPLRAANWELLGNTYAGVAPLAEGASNFAIQSYTQAIILDPFNPNYRITLGRIYFGLGDYENAIDTFKLAIAAKPDHANAHYNLAIAYRDNGQIDRAVEEMTIVLALVDRDSEDHKLAKIELERLETEQGTIIKAEVDKVGFGAEELNPPQPIEPELDPTLDLPEDSEPPEGVEGEDALQDATSPSPTPLP